MFDIISLGCEILINIFQLLNIPETFRSFSLKTILIIYREKQTILENNRNQILSITKWKILGKNFQKILHTHMYSRIRKCVEF